MIAKIQADLPLDHRIHQQPYHREHRQGRNPFGFLQPHRTDGRGMLDPAKPWFYRDMLFLIRLEHLSIGTLLWPYCGSQDGPSVRILRRNHDLWAHAEAISGLDLRGLGLRRTAASRPLLRDIDSFDPIVQDMVTPRPRLAPTPPLATPFVLGNGGLRIGGTGKPAGFHALDVLCYTRGLFSLGGCIGHSRLRGQLAGVHDKKTEVFYRQSPVRVFHFHLADDTASVPASRRLLAGPARFFKEQGQRAMLLTPRLQRLAHRTRTRHQRDQAHALLQAQPQGTFTVRLTVSHNALHSIETERHTLFDRHGSLCAVTGVPIAQAHAEWKALTADAETQEDLLEILTPIFAVPIGRPGWDQPCDWSGRLLIGPIQGDGRGILMEPGGREGINVQGVECDGTKDAVELRGKQRLENLAETVIVQRRSSQAILEQGEHPALLPARPYLIEGMVPIENRQEQRFYATATREDLRGVRRAEGSDKCRYVELTDYPEHQRQVGHRTDVLNGTCHEVPLLQSF